MNSILIVLGCLLYANDALYVTNSSEDSSGTSYPSDENEGETCILPPYPENGQWVLQKGDARPYEKIKENDIVKFECNGGFKLTTNNPYWVCGENWNTLQVPDCEELCPPLYPSSTYEMKCNDKKGNGIKCDEPTHGTYVEYKCAPFYETPFGYRKTLLCLDGKWNQKPVCQPICGKKTVIDKKAMASEKLENPWVIALYQKVNGSFQYVCGGSIVSLRVVLTAAHCITDENGEVLPKEDFQIGAGKLYSKYKAPEDTNAQYLELSKIIPHENYKGDSRRFLSDIAILVVKEDFILNEVIRPVCFDNLNSIYLHPGNVGEVSGWGQIEAGPPSEKLRTLEIPYKYETTCARELPAEWANKYNINDKICAGFFNKSKSVCGGDSGSGLIFKNTENNRYYIHGIVSLGISEHGQCNIQHNNLYTRVSYYYEYVDRLLSTYAPAVNDCKLPPHPKYGKWIIADEDKKPGDAVPSSTVLRLECDREYKLASSKADITCGSAYNMPSCQKRCPELNFPKGTEYTCTNKSEQTIPCSDAIDGTMLTYTCPEKVGISSSPYNVRTCVRGSWGTPQPDCLIPLNNSRREINTTLKPEQDTDKFPETPWTVIIYGNEPEGKTAFHCTGALISSEVVLTGVDCVRKYPKERLLVFAGKQYISFNDSRDLHAQCSKVSDIITDKGSVERYLADIALIIVKPPFNFTSSVQPLRFTDFYGTYRQNGSTKSVRSQGQTRHRTKLLLIIALFVMFKCTFHIVIY